MARLIPVDFDPFAPPRLVEVNFDPFNVAEEAERRRRAGRTPAADPRDVEADRRLQDRERGIQPAAPRTADDNRRLNRIAGGEERTGDRPMEQQRQDSERRGQDLWGNLETATPDARDTLAYIGTRLHVLNPQQYPFLFRGRTQLTRQEIGELVLRSSDEIAGMSPQEATGYLFGRDRSERRQQPVIQRDPLNADIENQATGGSPRERAGWQDFGGRRPMTSAQEQERDFQREVREQRASRFGPEGPGFAGGMGQTVLGVIQKVGGGIIGAAGALIDETPGGDSNADHDAGNYLQNLGRYIGERGRQRQAAAMPDYEVGSPEWYAFQGTESLIEMGAAIAGGAASRNPAMVTSTLMGLRVFADQYDESVRQGRTPNQALVDGTAYGLFEMIPETMALERIWRPGQRVLERVAVGTVGEGAQEVLTEVLQAGYDAHVLDQDMSWGQVQERLKQAGLLGTLVGGPVGAVGHVVQPSEERQAVRELDRMTFDPTQAREEAIRALDPTADVAPVPRGMIESAQPAQLTPEDRASPLDDNLIAEGKAAIARATAGAQADEILDQNIGHRTGDRVHVTVGNETRTGTIKDAFEEDDPELGKQHGVVIGWEDGRESRERINDLNDIGARIERAHPSEPPGNRIQGAAAREIVRRHIRGAESSGNDQADNPRSSADGRYQFIDSTFRRLYQRVYGRDPGEHPPREVKNDPAVQERLMDALMDENEAALRRGHHPLTPGNLYLAHVVGAGGANSVLQNPNASAEATLGAAVIAGNPQFRGMTNAQVAQWAAQRMGTAFTGGTNEPLAGDTVEPEYGWLERPIEGVDTAPARTDTPAPEPVGLASETNGDGTRAAPVVVTAPEHIDLADAQVAAPTEAQAEANNYRAGHLRWNSLDITIETPRGGERTGTAPDGSRWAVTMPDSYGYVRRTEGADGEQADVYIGRSPDSPNVYVIDQLDADTGKFDETKSMLGYNSREEALAAYRAGFSDGRGDDRIGGVTEMSVDQFREFLSTPHYSPVSGEAQISPSEDAAGAPVSETEAGGAAKPASETASPAASQAFAATDHVPALEAYVKNGTGSLNNLESFAKAQGITPQQARKVMGAYASRPGAPIRMTKGRPVKRNKAGRIIRKAIPSRIQRIGARTAPVDAMAFVRNLGGVQSGQHDLKNLGALVRHPGIINKFGRTVDEIGEALNDAGYITGERPTEAEVLDFLDRASRKRIYAASDTAAAIEHEQGKGDHDEAEVQGIEALAKEIGYSVTPDDIEAVMAYRHDGLSREAALDAAMRDAAAMALEDGPGTEYADAAETYYGEIAEQRDGAGDTAGGDRSPAEAVARPESDQAAEGGSGDATPQPTGSAEASQPVETAAAEPAAQSVEVTQPESTVDQAKVALQNALDLLNGVEPKEPAARSMVADEAAPFDQRQTVEPPIPARVPPAAFTPGMIIETQDVIHRGAESEANTYRWRVREMARRDWVYLEPMPGNPSGLRGEGRRLMAVDPDELRVMIKGGTAHVVDESQIEPQGEMMFQRLTEGDDPIFYSALERTVSASTQAKASAAQWAAMLGKTPGIRKEELEWSGIFEFLDMQDGPVSRETLLGVIRDGGIRVEEVVLGELGENQVFDEAAQLYTEVVDEPTQFHSWTSDPSSDTYRELLITLPPGEGGNPDQAPGTHWDQRGVVAHARFMEKTDADGNRVLFIEEIQSDWHQKGRDEGYERTLSEEELAERDAVEAKARGEYEAARKAMFDNAIEQNMRHLDGLQYLNDAPEQKQAINDRIAEQLSDETLDERQRIHVAQRFASPKHAQAVERTKLVLMEAMQAASRRAEGSIPDAPFKSSWPALILKRLIRWASDNGFDKIAWTTGAEQNERYSLEKHIESVYFQDNSSGGIGNADLEGPTKHGTLIIFPAVGRGEVIERHINLEDNPKALSEIIGEELAERLLAAPPIRQRSSGLGVRERRLEGLDLKTGGEGMRGFYDRNLVNIANDLIKKYGGKVGTVEVEGVNPEKAPDTPEMIAARAKLLAVRSNRGDEMEVANAEYRQAETEARQELEQAVAASRLASGMDTHPGFSITPELAAAARTGFPLFQLQRIQGKPVSEAEVSAIRDRLQTELDRLGISDRIAPKVANGLLTKERAQGAYFRRMIQVSTDMAINPMATLNHESIHAMRALGLFTDSEWTALSKAATQDESVMAFVNKSYPTASDAKRTEESIAELYARWRTGRMEAKGFVAKAFQRLLDFMAALGRAVAYVRGDRSLKAGPVLKGIERGEIGRRETATGRRLPSEGMSMDEIQGLAGLIRRTPIREEPQFQQDEGFDFEPAQPERTMTKAQRAELEARQQQGKARRGGQQAISDQDGGLFSAERDQGQLFQLRTPNSVWNDMLNRTRDMTGAAKTPGTRDKLVEAFERFRINFQDRVLPLLRTQTAIEKVLGRELTEEEQPYRQEALYTGRVGDQFEKLTDGIVEPMFETMKENGVTADELESYLYARHAPERNAKLKKEGVDDGSGMSDVEAAAIMARVDKAGKTEALESVAKWFDKLNAFAMDTRISGGTMSEAQADEWRSTYQNYAPLRGHLELPEEERPNMGQTGYSIKGPESKRAFGRKSQATDIIAHAIVQAQEAVIRAEKNRVAIELYNLAKANPDDNFWDIQKVTMKKRINEETGLIESYPVTQATAEDAPYTVNLKVNGKAQRITFNRHNPTSLKMAEAMRRMNEPELNFRIFQIANQWLSKANTTLSPDFIVSNIARDLETATANLSQFNMKGLRRDVAKSWPLAFAAAERGAFKVGGNSVWDQAWRDFSAEGGRISFNRIESVDQLRKDITKRFSKLQEKNLSPKEAGLKAWEGVKWTFDKIEKVNMGAENATRLSVYKNLIDRGVTKKQAAFIAKEITTNFNRRGVYGVLVNSLYLFANASTQGNARMIMALKNRRTQKIAGSLIVAGALVAMFNVALGGDDDDGVPYYDKISDFEKNTNLIFMIPGSGGHYIKIPMAYGYSVFPDLGRQLVDVFRGHTNPIDAASSWLFNAAASFNPLGGSESVINFLAPTLVDPVVDIQVDNRDFADRPIMPEPSPYGPPVPDSQRFWPSVPPYLRALTDAMNSGTGGDRVEAGLVDVSPETLQYLLNTATGSAGATITRMSGAIGKAIDGDPETSVELNDIPVLRRVVGAKPSWYDRAAFYARLRSVQDTVAMAREYRNLGDQEGQQRFVAEHQDVIALRALATQARTEMRHIRKARSQANIALENGRITQARHDAILVAAHEREERLFAVFNRRYLAHVQHPVRPD